MKTNRLLLAAVLTAFSMGCDPAPEIKPDPSFQGGGGAPPGSSCSTAQESTSILTTAFFPQANYENVISVCVGRATDGWLDVEAVVVGHSLVDAQALVVITDHDSGVPIEQTAEVSLALDLPHGSTPIAGSFNLPAGSYDVTLQVATGAPNATITLNPKTWLMATSRRDASVLP